MKPKLRVINHLHRTGGTLISKCVASLPSISLLSEVNPASGFMVLDPVFQANFWLRLLNDADATNLKDASFLEKIKVIHTRALERGDDLVIRNWAYLDFIGEPFDSLPSHKLQTVETLKEHFDIVQIATVRHPMDQWLSWCRYQGSPKPDAFSFSRFAEACSRFKSETQDLHYIRYEDFIADPDLSMRSLCENLDLQFDPVYRERWPYYHQISGDDNDRASGDWAISARPRPTPPADIILEATNNRHYKELLTFYDYR